MHGFYRCCCGCYGVLWSSSCPCVLRSHGRAEGTADKLNFKCPPVCSGWRRGALSADARPAGCRVMQPRHSRGVPDYIGTEGAERPTTTGGGRTEGAERTQSRPHPARKGAASPHRAARGREESRSRPAEATGRRHAPRPTSPYLDTIATTHG